MLNRLLRLIANSDGLVTTAGLARELKVSDELLSPMLEMLVAQGYLNAVQTDCQRSHCGGCSASEACSSSLRSLRLWTLTEKGERIVR